MKITGVLEIKDEDIKRSKELSRQYDALVLSELPKLQVNLEKLKGELFDKQEELRKAEYVGNFQKIADKKAEVYQVSAAINTAKTQFEIKADATQKEFEAINRPCVQQILPLVEAELKHLNDPEVSIFRMRGMRKESRDGGGDTEREVKVVTVETNDEIIGQKREKLFQLRNDCQTFLHKPLFKVVEILEEWQKEYNRLNLKQTKTSEMSLSMFKDVGGK